MVEDEPISFGLQTQLINSSKATNTTNAVTPPIWQSVMFGSDNPEEFAETSVTSRPNEYYMRYGNPTRNQVEAVLSGLERGEAALVLSSGMGAITTALMSILRSGDHVIAQRSHYAAASTLLTDYLPGWGIECTFVDQTSLDQWVDAVRPNTRLIYIETPSNPLMKLTDLRAVAEIARAHGITTVADNTFATPVNQRPLDCGIDVVVHSATKYLGGHNDVMAGAIVGPRRFIEDAWNFSLVSGAILSPFDAWLLLRGLRTLGLRVERQNQNALALARALDSHPRVERVNYPGLPGHPQYELARRQMSGSTGIMSFELKGGYEDVQRFLGRLKLPTYAASVGGYETLVVHPAALWSHQMAPQQRRAAGISDSLVRISVGIEDEADLLHDFDRALVSLAQATTA